jgi:CubicO group peptidase (beta-lactamase class C family)
MRANLTVREMLRAWRDVTPIAEQRSSAVVSALARPPQRRGAFRYSNLGYVVVGAAIDRVAGMPFEAALHGYVFEPLGVTSAGFGPPPAIHGHQSRVQLGGLVAGRGAPADPGGERSDNPAVMTPAGRLHLTLADWARFQRVFLRAGEPLLQESTVKHLLRLPEGGRTNKTMAMGWAPAAGLDGASYGMQGSNTRWSASAIIDAAFERTAMVVANDGRTRVLMGSARLAAQLLEDG